MGCCESDNSSSSSSSGSGTGYKFYTIENQYKTLEEVQGGLRKAGLE